MPKAKTTTKKKTQASKTPKKTTKPASAKATAGKKEPRTPKFFEAVGRRKTSTARVRLFTRSISKKGKGEESAILVNKKPYKEYFSISSLQKKLQEPLEKLTTQDKFDVSILVKGGGLSSQAEACRHGISRALVLVNSTFRKKLKKAGFLTRDPRMRERKKFGLKRARRAPQWSKR